MRELQEQWKNIALIDEIMLKHSFVQVVNDPTRIQGQNQSRLDLLFVTDGTFNYNLHIEEGISVHKTVIATLNISNMKFKKKLPSVQVHNLNRIDDTSVIDYLVCAYDNL